MPMCECGAINCIESDESVEALGHTVDTLWKDRIDISVNEDATNKRISLARRLVNDLANLSSALSLTHKDICLFRLTTSNFSESSSLFLTSQKLQETIDIAIV
jgi:hypothetical protein